jgi:hypothetical protein
MIRSPNPIVLTAIASVVLIGGPAVTVTTARAAPPTAQYSPGYEARLAEARKAALLSQPRVIVAPAKKRHHHRQLN